MKLKAGNEVWSNIFVNNRVTLENSKRKCIEDARLVFCTPYRLSWLQNQEFALPIGQVGWKIRNSTSWLLMRQKT